jgi:hypothetical protein
MRLAIPALAAALAILGASLCASSATAAPTCLDRQGDMARCGSAGAMPVGWSPPADMEGARLVADAPDEGKLIGLTVFLAGLFGLIALMPDFEGKWDREAGDDELGG